MQTIYFQLITPLCKKSYNIITVISGAGTAHPSGAPEFTPDF